MSEHFPRIESYEQLEDFLRNWCEWPDYRGQYDFVGMMYLFRACLYNLTRNALDSGQLEDYLENTETPLSEEEKSFLRQVVV